jgi:hypothetical protein
MPPLTPDPDAACEACGAFGAFRFDGETLCAECYAGRGSCCSAEFSGASPDTTPPGDQAPAGDCKSLA